MDSSVQPTFEANGTQTEGSESPLQPAYPELGLFPQVPSHTPAVALTNGNFPQVPTHTPAVASNNEATTNGIQTAAAGTQTASAGTQTAAAGTQTATTTAPRTSPTPRERLPQPDTLHSQNFDVWLPYMQAKLEIDGDAIGTLEAQFWYIYACLVPGIQRSVLPLANAPALRTPEAILESLEGLFENIENIRDD